MSRIFKNVILFSIFILIIFIISGLFAAELSFNNATRYARSYMWNDADKFFNKTIKLDPFSSDYKYAYAEFLRKGARYFHDRAFRLKKAIAFYDSAIELDPLNANIRLGRGLARLQSGDIDASFRDFQRASLLDPEGFDIAYAIGYSGMNVWGFIDAASRVLVIKKLKFILNIEPWHAGGIFAKLWKASGDFNLLKDISCVDLYCRDTLVHFVKMNNLWKFRKELTDKPGDSIDPFSVVEKIKDFEDSFRASAWKSVEGKWIISDSGSDILEKLRAISDNRSVSIVMPEDWIFISDDLKDARYCGGLLHCNGTIYGLLDNTSGDNHLIISLRGSSADGIWPYMIVRLNGSVIGESFVGHDGFKDYVFKARFSKTVNLISVTFLNDYFNSSTKEDRNLWVGKAFVRAL